MEAALQTQTKTPAPVQTGLAKRDCVSCNSQRAGLSGGRSKLQEDRYRLLTREGNPVLRAMTQSSPVGTAHALLESDGGRPLDGATRTSMESAFGHDFSRVRIHTGGRVAQSAETAGAEAYSIGQHIVFAPGEYAPETPAGRQLLAHELAHVAQQGESAASGLHTPGSLTALDHEADSLALQAVSGPVGAAAIRQPVSSTHRGILFHVTGRQTGENLADCINRHLGQHGILTHVGWILITICGIVATIAGAAGAEAGVIPPAVAAGALCMAAATGIEVGVLAHCIWDCR